MRKAHVTFECDERVLGSVIMDLTERPNTRIVNVKGVSELPPHVNKKAARANGHATGLTGWEVFQKLSHDKPDGPTFNEIKAAFATAGLKPSSVNSFLTAAQKRGEIKRVPVKGQRLSYYKIAKP